TDEAEAAALLENEINCQPYTDQADQEATNQITHCAVLRISRRQFLWQFPKPTRHLFHDLTMDHAAPTRHNPWHRPPSPRPNQRHVRTAIVGNHFNVATNIPAHLAATMRLFNELLIVAGLVFGTVISEDIGRDYLGVVFQKAEGAAEANAVRNQVIGNHDADF